MPWIKGRLKNRDGSLFTPSCLASKVYMDETEATTLSDEIASLNAQELGLTANVQDLGTALDNMSEAVSSLETLSARTNSLNASIANLVEAVTSLSTTISGA